MTRSHVLMVRPDHFSVNPETAATNVFQRPVVGDIAELACAEFDNAVAMLSEAGVEVTVLPGLPDAPDAVFPNNWISFHEDFVVVYPMLNASRRRERRVGALASLIGNRRIIDLTQFEADGQALEGTGSLVLDQKNNLAYACLGPRTHPAPLAEWSRQTGIKVIEFEAELDGKPVYHTNVIMAIGEDEALMWHGCGDDVRAGLASTGHRIVELSDDEVRGFAGNAMELQGHERAWWMSATARAALTETLQQPIYSPAIATIEASGGSLRCMMCEVISATNSSARQVLG
ncbi:MAG: hypothetical protein JNJ45_05170 [Chthonomonas sp.]|nr:hypothetical protein [Chthonomonas sp.]